VWTLGQYAGTVDQSLHRLALRRGEAAEAGLPHSGNPVKDAVATIRPASSIGELVVPARHFLDHDLLPYPVELPVAA
jgi:hypothetical protein